MRVSAPAFLRASKLGLSAGSPVIVLKLVDFISLFSDFSGASVPKSYTSVRAWGSYFIIYLRILFRSKEKKSLIIRDRIHIYISIECVICGRRCEACGRLTLVKHGRTYFRISNILFPSICTRCPLRSDI